MTWHGSMREMVTAGIEEGIVTQLDKHRMSVPLVPSVGMYIHGGYARECKRVGTYLPRKLYGQYAGDMGAAEIWMRVAYSSAVGGVDDLAR